MTPQERLSAARKARGDQRNREAEIRAEQEAADIEAIAALESQFGFDRIRAIRLSTWAPDRGAPTTIAVRVPLGSEKLCQRFIETINRAKEGSRERLAAQDALAYECWEYPARGTPAYEAALELAPLVLAHAAVQIVRAAEGVAEAEGKG